MPTTPDQATRDILNSLQTLNDPQFTQRYLDFLNTAKSDKDISAWNEELRYQLGPTQSCPEERKNIIKQLISNTKLFLNITKPISTNNPNDVPYNIHPGFDIDALIIKVKEKIPPLTTVQPNNAQAIQSRVSGFLVLLDKHGF